MIRQGAGLSSRTESPCAGSRLTGCAVARRWWPVCDLVGIAAGISTLAAVAAAASVCDETDRAAVGVTERPVDEHLGFDARRGRHIVDFLEGQFASQDDAGEAEVVQCAAAPARLWTAS